MSINQQSQPAISVKIKSEMTENPEKLSTEENPDSATLKDRIKNFILAYTKNFENISVRDILTWVEFINSTKELVGIQSAIFHGACMIYIDAIESKSKQKFLVEKLVLTLKDFFGESDCYFKLQPDDHEFSIDDGSIKVGPFTYTRNTKTATIPNNFIFKGTTLSNLQRILRALHLPNNKAILLEGAPGVGKTSIVMNLAKLIGKSIVRINLSEQSDISELFGSDLPVEGKPGLFEWKDGPLLEALKNGDWIVLDELNLASQSVLEGLNSILDHRGKIYISELNKTIEINDGADDSEKTIIFACQNPLNQGGGRKGLPASFLNRFTHVWFSELKRQDFLNILNQTFPTIDEKYRVASVKFTEALNLKVVKNKEFGLSGAPWEFNLRDLCKAFSIIQDYHEKTEDENERIKFLQQTFSFIYASRMRTKSDRDKIMNLFKEHFGISMYVPTGKISICKENPKYLTIGEGKFHNLDRITNYNDQNQKLVFTSQLATIEALNFSLHPTLQNYVPILIGSLYSGKTSIVKLLAEFHKADLKIINANSSMDATELLGSFEQDNKERFVKECLLRYVPKDVKIESLDQILSYLPEHLHDYYNLVVKINGHGPKLSMDDNGNSTNANSANGAFRWIDSDLIKGIEQGSWVLIDDANCCPAAVLDRLNALVEPNGVMFLPECGNNQRIIKPHPNFRLILAYDPNSNNSAGSTGGNAGEISRAMRNRGTEIFVADNWMANKRDFQGYLQKIKSEDPDFLNVQFEDMKILEKNDQSTENKSAEKGDDFEKFYSFTTTDLKRRLLELTEYIDQENPMSNSYCQLIWNICDEVLKDDTVTINLSNYGSLDFNKINKNIDVKKLRNLQFLEDFKGFLELDFVKMGFLKEIYDILGFLQLILVCAVYYQKVASSKSKINKNNYKLSNLQTVLDFLILKLFKFTVNLEKSEKSKNFIQSSGLLPKIKANFQQFIISNATSSNSNKFFGIESEKNISTISEKCLYAEKNLSSYLSNQTKLDLLESQGILLKRPKVLNFGNLFEKLSFLDPSLENRKIQNDADDFMASNWFRENQDSLGSEDIIDANADNQTSMENIGVLKNQINQLEAKFLEYPILVKNLPEVQRDLENIRNMFSSSQKILHRDFHVPLNMNHLAEEEETAISNCLEIRLVIDKGIILDPVKALEYYTPEIKNYIFLYGNLMMILPKFEAEEELKDVKIMTIKEVGEINNVLEDFKISVSNLDYFGELIVPQLKFGSYNEQDSSDKKPNFDQTLAENMQKIQASILLLKNSQNPVDNQIKKMENLSLSAARTEGNLLALNGVKEEENSAIYKKIICNAFSGLKDDQKTILDHLSFLVDNYKVTLHNTGNYVNLIGNSVRDLKKILDVNFTDQTIRKLCFAESKAATETSPIFFASQLKTTCKNFLSKFLPLPEIDPKQQANLDAKRFSLILSEATNFQNILEKYYELEYVCELEENLDYEKLPIYQAITKVRSITKKMERKLKIFKNKNNNNNNSMDFNNVDMVFDIDENYARIKNLINSFYFQYFYQEKEALSVNFGPNIKQLDTIINALSEIYIKKQRNNQDFTEIIHQWLIWYRHGLLLEDLLAEKSDIESRFATKLSNETKNQLAILRYQLTQFYLCSKDPSFAIRPNYVNKVINLACSNYVNQESEMAEIEEDKESWFKVKVLNQDLVNTEGDDAAMDEKFYQDMFTIKEEEEEDIVSSDHQKSISLETEIIPLAIHQAIQNITSIKNSEMSISPDLLKLYNEILDIDNSKMKKTFLQTQIESFADNEKSFYPKLARYIILLSDMQSECQNVEDSKKAVEPVIKKLTENNEKFNEKYDLYNEVHLNENILVQPTLLPLKHRLINLLSSYPENPIVIDILKLIQKIESYEITKSPIAKFCQALEILLNKCEVWNKNAPKSMRLHDVSDSIKNLVIKWRRCEIKNWEGCLQNNERKNQKLVLVAHFSHLWDLVQRTISDESKSQDLATMKSLSLTINEFMTTSNILEFNVRLLVLNIVAANFCEKLPLLKNLFYYWLNFQPAVLSTREKLTKIVKTQAKDFVKISKWNHQNFFQVKDNVDRSHKILARYTRKFLDLQMEPVHQTIYFGTNLREFYLMDLVGVEEINLQRSATAAPSSPNLVNNLIKNLDSNTVSKNLSKMSIKLENQLKISQKAFIKFYNNYTDEIFNGMKDLNSLRATASEPKRKLLQLKNIQVRKENLFKSHAKQLKKLNISFRHGLQFHQVDWSFEILRAKINQGNGQTSESSLIYQVLKKFNKLTGNLNSPNKELQKIHFEIIKGNAINQLSILAKLVNTIENLECNIKIINKLKLEMDQFGDFQENLELVEKFENRKIKIYSEKMILDNLGDGIEVPTEMPTAEVDSINFSKSINNLRTISEQLTTSSSKANIAVKFDTLPTSIFNQKTFKNQQRLPENEFPPNLISNVAEQFLIYFQKIDKFVKNLQSKAEMKENAESADDFLQAFRLDFEPILLLSETILSGDLVNSQGSKKNSLSSGDNFSKLLLEFVKLLKLAEPSEKQSSLISLLQKEVKNILQIIQNYLLNIVNIISHFTNFTFQTYNIILENGFCRPKEIDELESQVETNEADDDNDVDNNEETGPQGLADTNDDLGGANDVSKQIEEEWQLEGLRENLENDDKNKDDEKDQNNEQNDNQPKNDQEKDDAIELEDLDFEGEFEDLPEKDKEEMENKEEKEIEDKMENFDGEDENKETLDERMWGDENDDDEDQNPEDQENKEENNKMEETGGKGMDKKDKQLAAKDDRIEETDGNAEEEENNDDDQNDNDEEMNDQREFDPNEYDDNFEGLDKENKEPNKDNEAENEMDDWCGLWKCSILFFTTRKSFLFSLFLNPFLSKFH